MRFSDSNVVKLIIQKAQMIEKEPGIYIGMFFNIKTKKCPKCQLKRIL